MKSTILISRITRVIETEGTLGEGASLAKEYSEAVRKANSRLEAVLAAIDAKQVSDAVRLMEDAPKLMDEIGTLDFNRLPDWETLCSRKNWTAPVKLDHTLLDRVLLFNESTDIVEPFLRMYRKAMRTNNTRLAVQSLQRLVQIDHSQNWSANLIQAQESLLAQFVSDFRAAKASGDTEVLERIAQEFAETNWPEQTTSKGADEIRSYIAEKEARQRDEEGQENLSIIRRCMDENWNCQLALSMLQALDNLAGKGLVLSETDKEVVESCRTRCAAELEEAEKERRWKELCENLYTAIQQENTASIRDVLSSPEFLDREPDPSLLKQAQLVIDHEEAARKRKILQIAVCSLAGLIAVLAISGWWLRQKLFNDRCEGEAAKLTALEEGAHAVDRLAEALRRLKEDDPEVYADPRVNVFDGKLKTMQIQMTARTNEIASVLTELYALREANWGDNIDSVTGRIERVNSLITKDDDAFRVKLLEIKSSWADHCEEKENSDRYKATQFHKTLVSHVNVISKRLKTELMSEDLKKEVETCKASIDEWKRIHAQHAPAIEGVVDEATKSFLEAEKMQENLQTAILKLKDATSAKDLLESRKTLCEFYSGYPFVKEIGDHPVTAEDAESIVQKTSAEQTSYANMLKSGVDEETFAAFLEDNVASLAEIPSYYSLYGVSNNNRCFFAVSKGKPQIKTPSYESNYIVEGEVLDFFKGEMVAEMPVKKITGRPICTPIASSEEIKSVVDLASRQNMTLFKFEHEIIRLIEKHLEIAGENDFLKDEVETYGKYNEFTIGRYPAIRRVQLLQIYFTWLRDDLQVMPKDGSLSLWYDQIEKLAQPVRLDNIPEDLTWTCMNEYSVRQRNTQCAHLLSQMASDNFAKEYESWRNTRVELRKLLNWNIEYAGCIAYNPNDPRWMKDHSVVLPAVKDNVIKDHPLYVLRRENGKLTLKRALIPYKNGTTWGIAPGMSKVFVPGDPLFQISDQGQYIDAESTIKGIFKGVPASIAKQYAAKIPLFDLEK